MKNSYYCSTAGIGRLHGLAVACWTTDHYHLCSNLGVGISEGCFIFDFASLPLEVARPIWPTLRTKVAIKHQPQVRKFHALTYWATEVVQWYCTMKFYTHTLYIYIYSTSSRLKRFATIHMNIELYSHFL